MKSEIKKKWVAALKSGEYKQGRLHLKKDNTYCCLGVLCDIHRKECSTGWIQQRTYMGSFLTYLGERYVLPLEVANWAGLEGSNPLIPGHNFLASLNDIDSLNFEQIADLIEE